MRLPRIRHGSGGFTLIEIIIMLIILSILAAVMLPRLVGLTSDASDAFAKNLLASLRTANQLEYGKRLINGGSIEYTMGDILGRISIEGPLEHVNYSNHGMKMHILVRGESYWYTMSDPTSGLPSVTEWKRTSW